jgi:predicted nucleotidyltransferase
MDINEIKRTLRPIFESNPVYTAVLFGSYARGEASDHSDVDIVIDSRGQLLNIRFYGVLDEICEKLNQKVDLFELSEIRKPSPIYTSIQQEGIRIYEREG